MVPLLLTSSRVVWNEGWARGVNSAVTSGTDLATWLDVTWCMWLCVLLDLGVSRNWWGPLLKAALVSIFVA